MKVGNAKVSKGRFSFKAFLFWAIAALFVALVITWVPIFVALVGTHDEGRAIAVKTASWVQQTRPYPYDAWIYASRQAEEKGATIPIESFFVDPDGTVRYQYVRTVDTPIWSQVDLLKRFTVVTADVSGRPAYL